MVRYNLSFVGAGRVAGTLSHKLYLSGHKIIKISSPSESRGRDIALMCNSSWSPEPVFEEPADILIVSVPDHRLSKALSSIKCAPETLVVHTAGSFGLEIFPHHIVKRGVFYPLQTFTEGREIDFNGLPFLIESDSEASVGILENLANSTGGKTYMVDAEKRKQVHLAAVFVCNFTNHLLTAGKELMDSAGLSFGILEPLIKETISKALENGPENSQTGPAIRNDQNTIKKHLDLLSFSSDLKGIYEYMTRSIGEHYKKRING